VIGLEPGRWDGLDGLGEEALAQVRAEGVAVVTEAADYFVGELKTTLTGTRTGRPYKVSKRGPLHIASAPGEAPAVLFGALRNSIGRTEAKVVDGTSIEAEVGVGLGVRAEDNEVAENYAARLEYGGVDSRGVRILARPYIEPTRLRVEPIIADMFAAGVGSK
jgi:hypothetical protein